MKVRLLGTALLGLAVQNAYSADNFTTVGGSFAENGSCPQSGFLVQQSTATMYDMNLATGHYSVLKGPGLKPQNEMTSADYLTPKRNKLNALAYNVNDDYLYAWFYEQYTVGKIGNDFETIALDVISPDGFRFADETGEQGDIRLPNFYIGDISLDPEDNAYYVYHRGNNYGLFRIELDEQSPNYLQMTKVVDRSTLNLVIFDIAFHPDYENDPKAYSVDRNGNLYSIDVATGASVNLGNVGERGTYGATYFGINDDGEPRLYISRNHDGKIFEVDVSAENPTATLKAQGPKSGQNDGARCATAPVSLQTVTVDYGDAPASYAAGGDDASHQLDVDSNVWLGEVVDGEAAPFTYPLSDDEAGETDDEDGVQILGDLKEGRNSVILVRANADDGASAGSFLNAWIDFDQDGEFEESERIIDNQSIATSGTDQPVFISVPAESISSTGEHWARFRLTASNADGLAPTGAAPSGEVEDMMVNIIDNDDVDYVENYYPSPASSVTLMYEDLWPIQGDYDMNDLVVYYRTKQTVDTTGNVNEVISTDISGDIVAVGAAYSNGFAVRIKGLDRDNVDEDNLRLTINGNVVEYSAEDEIGHEILEAGDGSDDAILVVTPNMLDVVLSGEECTDVFSGYSFYRTIRNCDEAVGLTFELHVPFDLAVAQEDLPLDVYDPFIFASGENYRSAEFPFVGRELEIHLQDKGYTPQMDTNLFGLNEDASEGTNTEGSNNFVNENGMPWAMQVNFEWKHPYEGIDAIDAFYHFVEFVESAGGEYPDWFDHTQVDYADTTRLYLD